MARLGLKLAAAVGVLAVAACAGYSRFLPRVDEEVVANAPMVRVHGPFGDDPPVLTSQAWRTRRAPLLRRAFQDQVYGAMPTAVAGKLLRRVLVADRALGGAARVEQLTVGVDVGATPVRVNVLLVLPRNAPGPFPTIVMQTFCGNRAAFPEGGDAIELISAPPKACDGALSGMLSRMMFGRYAHGPPLKAIVDHRYAVAIFYAGDVVPDDPVFALPVLVRLAPNASPASRPGAIAAWAWSYSRVIDVLDEDRRLDPGRTAIWGHSRNGKAALLAAAFDERIDLVIAHQSGKGGASLTRSDVGESVAQIQGLPPLVLTGVWTEFGGPLDFDGRSGSAPGAHRAAPGALGERQTGPVVESLWGVPGRSRRRRGLQAPRRARAAPVDHGRRRSAG